MRFGIVATSLMVAAACQTRNAQFTSEDASQIRSMFDSTVVNVRAHDWTKWSQQYADDAVVQPPNGKTAKGLAAILAWGQAFPPVEDIRFMNVQVAGEGDMAYGTSDYLLKVQGMPADTGKQLVVFKRSNGKWEVLAASFNSDLPVPVIPTARRR